MKKQHAILMDAMTEYDKGDPERIQHFVKVHDFAATIGILEGPDETEKKLRFLGGYTEEQIERVRYVVGHHHTYKNIDGLDYQILVEADFLVTLYENHSKYTSVLSVENKIIKTKAGTRLLENMFKE